jgi:hypothetical protein
MATHITIKKEIGIGDAGLPFNLSLNIYFEIQDGIVLIHECIEDSSPYDNPPEIWYERMKEISDDFFYELNPNLKVVYK